MGMGMLEGRRGGGRVEEEGRGNGDEVKVGVEIDAAGVEAGGVGSGVT